MGLLDGGEHVELLVDVDHQAHVVAQRLLDGLHARDVLARVGIVDFHLVVAAAVAGVEAPLGEDVLDGVVGPPAAPVRLDPIRHRAPQAEQRLAGDLPDQIPERDVERSHAVAGQAHPADAAVGEEHFVPQLADHPRILADEQRLQTRLEIDLDRLGTAAAERQRVAEASHALVGVDERRDHAVVLELQRHGPGTGHVQNGGLDSRNFHGLGSSPAEHATFARGLALV